jgi:hypothetical protein
LSSFHGLQQRTFHSSHVDNFQIRALFHVGHWDKVHEQYNAMPNDSERYFYHLRAYLAQRQGQEALQALQKHAPGSEFQAIKIIADHHTTQDGQLDRVIAAIKEMLMDPVKAQNPRVRVVLGEFFASVDLLEEAVQTVGEFAKQKDIEWYI